jgi:hypothetical protein
MCATTVPTSSCRTDGIKGAGFPTGPFLFFVTAKPARDRPRGQLHLRAPQASEAGHRQPTAIGHNRIFRQLIAIKAGLRIPPEAYVVP